jgi:hypothetical protein
MSHKISIIDKDGNQSEITLPDFAMDATQEKLIKSIQALGKMNPKTAKAYEDLINETKNAVTATEDASDQQKKDAKALQNTVQNVGDKQVSALRQFQANFADRVGKDMRDTFTSGGNILTAAIKTATVGLAAGAGLLYKTFMDTSEAFRSLAQQGLGGAGASGTEAQDAVADLTRLGMSASEAAGLLTSFGQASAILGKANFSKFVSGIAGAGSFAADLGLTLDEAAEFAAEEIDIRQRSLSGELQLNAMNRQSIEESIMQTQRFAGVMGRSMKDINASKRAFFEDNTNINSLLMRLSKSQSERLNAQINTMMGAAGAIGGDYEKLMGGLVNAAANQTPILDSNLQGIANLGSAAGDLYQNTLDLSAAMQTGDMGSAKDAVNRINRSLLALDEGDLRILEQRAQGGDAISGMLINARRSVMVGGEKLNQAFNKAAAANDPMVTAAANFQNVLSRITGEFTTFRNALLGQFATPLNALMDNFALSGDKLAQYNEQREKAINADANLNAEQKKERIKALRTQSLFDTLNNGLSRIATAFMNKFFPKLNEAGDGVGTFVDIVVTKANEIMTGIETFIKDLKGDTFGAKLADAAKKLFALALPGIIYVLTETAKAAASALFSSPAVIDALAMGIGLLFAASTAKSALAAGVTSLLRWVMTGSALSAIAAPAATAATTAAGAATGGGLLAAATGAYGLSRRGGGGILESGARALKAIPGSGLAGRALTAAGGIGSAAMVGKDAYDVGKAYLTGGKMKGEDIGGVAGGVLGGIAGLVVGGPVGAALGASLGNYIGNKAGEYYDSYFNKDDAKKGSAEVAAATKEQLLQQDGLAAMAMDPAHIKAVGAALKDFNNVSVANISAGLTEFNPKLEQMFNVIHGIKTAFVDNVNNKLQRLLTVITGLNVEGLKLPITTQHLGSLAEQITAMPINKIESLATAFSALTKALGDFGSLLSSTWWGRALDAFSGKQDETANIIKVLNTFAKEVKSDELLKAAQATMAFNAGLSGYAAVPADPARTSATGQQSSPADQVNTASNMNYNNPMLKFDTMINQLVKLNQYMETSTTNVTAIKRKVLEE